MGNTIISEDLSYDGAFMGFLDKDQGFVKKKVDITIAVKDNKLFLAMCSQNKELIYMLILILKKINNNISIDVVQEYILKYVFGVKISYDLTEMKLKSLSRYFVLKKTRRDSKENAIGGWSVTSKFIIKRNTCVIGKNIDNEGYYLHINSSGYIELNKPKIYRDLVNLKTKRFAINTQILALEYIDPNFFERRRKALKKKREITCLKKKKSSELDKNQLQKIDKELEIDKFLDYCKTDLRALFLEENEKNIKYFEDLWATPNINIEYR